MELVIGSIVTGKVTDIAKFGAFVELAPGKSGLVHISEIADRFVREVRDYLAVGQEVQVKIVGMDGGKINLSIKASGANLAPLASENAPAPRENRRPSAPRGQVYKPKPPEPEGEVTFEDRLKRFMKDSESKNSDVRKGTDRKGGVRRRGK